MANINQFNSNEKIMRYIDKLNLFLNQGKTLVVTELDLTNECNNKCPNCTGRKYLDAELTWNEVKQIIEDLSKLDNKSIILSGGGEPLMHPNFVEALQLINSKGMSVGLNSNGLGLTEEKAENIARYCKFFRISLDAGSPEMYKKTHGMDKPAFDKVVSNIKMMSEIKKNVNQDLSFGVGFLTGRHTIKSMEDFVMLSKECGVDFAQFRPFTNDVTFVLDEYNRLKEKYEDNTFKLAASMQKYKYFESNSESRSYDKCRGMFFSTTITANARMYACLHHRQDDRFLIGDMRAENKSIVEIWNSYHKYNVYENINVEECPRFCRNDSFNRTLNLLDMDVVHSEFL